MMSLIESGAGRVAARIQSLGANFDPEILSLPGGSIIAVLLWAYAAAMLGMKRQERTKQLPSCAGCLT